MYALMLAGLMLAAWPAPCSWALQAGESELRAAVVVGILRFTRWPEGSGRAHTVCLLGDPISAEDLLRVDGKSLPGGISLRVHRIGGDDPGVAHCDVVVLGPNSPLGQVADTLHTNRVLTICDGCRIEGTHVMVRLLRHRDRIGFEVDVGEARRRQLQFSANLLDLALKVHR